MTTTSNIASSTTTISMSITSTTCPDHVKGNFRRLAHSMFHVCVHKKRASTARMPAELCFLNCICIRVATAGGASSRVNQEALRVCMRIFVVHLRVVYVLARAWDPFARPRVNAVTGCESSRRVVLETSEGGLPS